MPLYTSPAGDAVYLHLYAQLIQGSKCFLEQLWACISLFLSMSLYAAQHYEGSLCYFSCTICLASFSMCVPFYRKQHGLEASKIFASIVMLGELRLCH